MKNTILLLLVLSSLSFVKAQSPDWAASYILREVHLYSARQYSSKILSNQVNYLAWMLNVSTVFAAPYTLTPVVPAVLDQTIGANLSRAICLKHLFPNKILKCNTRLSILTAATLATTSIAASPSPLTINNGVRIRIGIEAMAIQNMINEYINK
ncbi:hypothetical protein OAC51_03915 [Flavobacteriaceae bacterium]|nr:hypothetical protein [Flavobacteriaceae bacterium]